MSIIVNKVPRSDLMASLNGSVRVVTAIENLIDNAIGLVTTTFGSNTGDQDLSVYQPKTTVLTNTTASFTTAQESKLSGIAAGAEVNVQSDWDATSGDAFILNKPTIPAAFDYNANRTLSRDFGKQNDSTNHYLVATWTANNGAYAGGTSRIEVFGQGITMYTLLINAFLNSVPNAWDVAACSCSVFAPLGLKDSDLFTLIVNYSTRTFKLYYKHPSNAWNMKYIVTVDSFFNSCSLDTTKDATGVASLPTSDFTITTTITV